MYGSSRKKVRTPPPALVAVAGWIIPGAGYWLIKHRARAMVTGVTIITLFLSGMLLAGVRVIDVPGYDRFGGEVKIADNGNRIENLKREPQYDAFPWALTGRGFVGEVANKPWYVCQFLTGPLCLISSKFSLVAARHGIPMSHARIYEIGTLYTAVAGLLNLLVIIDAGYRASKMQEGP